MKRNANISIIQLIENGNISFDLEVEKITANENVNINIEKFLKKSIEFTDLTQKIDQKKQLLLTAPDEEKQFHRDEIKGLNKIKQNFKMNALNIANLFSKIEIRTERLESAYTCFLEGEITKANEILDSKDLMQDQFNIIAYVSFLQSKLKV